MILDSVIVVLALVGLVFMLLAVFGLLRLPDVYMRMQATTKATTLGCGCLMVAAGLHFGSVESTAKAVMVIVLLFVTQPIAAHMVARAAYVSQVPVWPGTVVDELAGHYDPETHELFGEESAAREGPEGA